MSVPQADPTPPAQRQSPAPVTWRVWPLAEGGIDAWAILGAVVLAGLAVVWYTQSVSLGLVAAIIVAASAERFFFPTVYELSALGVTQFRFGRRRRVPWNMIDRYEVGRCGVFLSSAGAPLEAFRGIYLPWSNKRDEVLANITYYLAHRNSGNASTIHRSPAPKM